MRKYLIGVGIVVTVIGTAAFALRGENGEWMFMSPSAAESDIVWPMERSAERAKLLTFGLYVTPDPDQNPIDPPERFAGYHTALDLEILPGEENTAVSVKTICEGPVVRVSVIEGYGGTVVQRCDIHNEPVTVIYGHVDPATFTVSVEDVALAPGTRLGDLAPAHTEANGDNRKHLHLGIHKGEAIELRGYVQNERELRQFIDPLSVLP